jgi:hypothetical protein
MIQIDGFCLFFKQLRGISPLISASEAYFLTIVGIPPLISAY